MKTRHYSLLFFLFVTLSLNGQSTITLEDIWQNYTFSSKSVPGFNFLSDGKHYTRIEGNVIKEYDLTSGKYVNDILKGSSLKDSSGFNGTISSFVLSGDERKLLIKSEVESIYRRSTKAFFHVVNLQDKSVQNVFGDGKIRYASFSPDAKKVAFVYQNNLYYKDLASGKLTQITVDGKHNEIINGATDWVYEEEFAFAKAFYWSPDGNKIAYIRFDEREVPEFTMTRYTDDTYPVYETFKYPKVGEKNAKVSAHIYNLKNSLSVPVALGDDVDFYIPRLKWTQDKNQLCVFKMNRHQNHLQLLLADGNTGRTSLLLDEKNKYFIDITDNLTFLKDGNHFIWTSEKDGYNHIYLYNMKGEEKALLTPGQYDVTQFYGVDEKNKKVYYQAAEKSPLEKHVFVVNLKGNDKMNLTPTSGTSRAQFSSTFEYFVHTHSTINSPASYTVRNRNGKSIRVIEDNKKVVALQKEYGVTDAEFFKFKTSEGIELNGYMIKPNDFDESRIYPVFMTQYSGPNSQSVTDGWKGNNYWWYQMLAQEGFIVACVDPRGTGARGEEFRKMTYMKLGHYETIDQIEAAKYLGKLPYVDANRIGIYGWSYGGYMSSLAILKGNDVFNSAIAVAPVTSWKWYDTIYTERYMRTLSENESGYNENSPVYFADRLKGNYLLVHGVADDNVHFQNTAEIANALIKANKQFDTYFYPNRNHGIYGDNARIHLFTKMTNFLKEHLINDQESLKP